MENNNRRSVSRQRCLQFADIIKWKWKKTEEMKMVINENENSKKKIIKPTKRTHPYTNMLKK